MGGGGAKGDRVRDGEGGGGACKNVTEKKESKGSMFYTRCLFLFLNTHSKQQPTALEGGGLSRKGAGKAAF